MALTLQTRFRLQAAAIILHSVLFLSLAVLIVLPALVQVDRTLAPLQGVFAHLSERQSRLVERLDSVAAMLELQTVLEPGHRHLSRLTGPERSLMPQYAAQLDPTAIEQLVAIENRFAAVETALLQVEALHELGDSPAARVQLRAVEASLSAILRNTTEVMALALERGTEARTRYQLAMLRLEWVAVAWFVTGAGLLFFVGFETRRRVLQPIRHLDAAVRGLARGEWKAAVAPQGDDEVATLARNFNEMAETLRDRAGRHARLVTAGELLAGVAHEINNPLQAIRAGAELNVEKQSDEAAADEWRRVLKQANRAAKLVTDLLKFVRPTKHEPSLVSVNDVVREGLDLIEFQYRADGITVTLDLGEDAPPVHADPDELLQVVVNVLGNAHGVLETHAGPRQVWIRTGHVGDEVLVTLRDSGPGVPAEVRGRIFDPFFSTRSRGVGLGLAVSRDIVRRWGGRLVLDDTDTGASFTMALPASRVPAPLPDSPIRAESDGHLIAGSRVLVVDDEEAIRNVLVRFFRRLGATVETAAGGEAALEQVRARPFDLVILDLRMPDLDGIAVYRRLRESQPAVAARTIFLSGDISRIDADVDIDPGRLLVKPIELSELRRVAGRVLGGP